MVAHVSLMPALRRQRQKDPCAEFEASLIFILSCRITRAIERDPVSTATTKTKPNKNVHILGLEIILGLER